MLADIGKKDGIDLRVKSGIQNDYVPAARETGWKWKQTCVHQGIHDQWGGIFDHWNCAERDTDMKEHADWQLQKK